MDIINVIVGLTSACLEVLWRCRFVVTVSLWVVYTLNAYWQHVFVAQRHDAWIFTSARALAF